jgi:hypothetical protein
VLCALLLLLLLLLCSLLRHTGERFYQSPPLAGPLPWLAGSALLSLLAQLSVSAAARLCWALLA